jgi:beta-glucanase (GH16 family)
MCRPRERRLWAALAPLVAMVIVMTGCSGSSEPTPSNGHHGGTAGAAGASGAGGSAPGAGGSAPEAGWFDAPSPVPDASLPGDETSPDAGDLADAIADARGADATSERVPTEAGGIIPGRTLTWSDEFDGPAGGAPDPSKWRFETGGGGFGNNELQYYTNRRENSYLDGMGHLVIEAIAEAYMGRMYTSARINTGASFSQRYGRFEARVQLPGGGKGVWPAFWVVGTSINTVGWPRCGEFDIMENRGSEPTINRGSAHGPGYSGGAAFTKAYTLPGGQRLPDDFHEFAIEWNATSASWSVDGVVYSTMTPADLQARNAMWVFDGPMYILLNLAIGGNFDGNPTAATMFPTKMIVDYVRVYEAN